MPRSRLLAVFAVSSVLVGVIGVFAAYGRQWPWTGFADSTALWDWLSLMLFPVVAIVLPEWIRRGEPFGARARGAAMIGLGAFAVLVIGGYHWGWTWTGFTGNTFRDWLDLMIAPFLLPVALKVVQTRHLARGASHAQIAPDDFVLRISIPR